MLNTQKKAPVFLRIFALGRPVFLCTLKDASAKKMGNGYKITLKKFRLSSLTGVKAWKPFYPHG